MPSNLPKLNSFTIKQRLIMAAVIVLLPIILVISIKDHTQQIYTLNRDGLFPKIQQVMFSSNMGQDEREIKLPFYYDGKHDEKLFFKITLDYSPEKSGVFWLTPDDCVESINVNDTDIHLNEEQDKRRCSWNRGFRLDLTSFLQTGNNDINIVITNKNGRTGLAFDSILK